MITVQMKSSTNTMNTSLSSFSSYYEVFPRLKKLHTSYSRLFWWDSDICYVCGAVINCKMSSHKILGPEITKL